MKNTIKTLLFLTSYSLLFIIVALVELIKNGDIVMFVVYTSIFALLSVLSFLLMAGVKHFGEKISIDVTKIESVDSALLPYISHFAIPGVVRYFGYTSQVVNILTIVIIIIGFVISYFPMHPILRVFGYRFFKIDTSTGNVYTLIARRDVRNRKSIKFVIRVSENLIFEGDGK